MNSIIDSVFFKIKNFKKNNFISVFLFFITQKHFFLQQRKLSSTATANSSSFLIKNAYQN